MGALSDRELRHELCHVVHDSIITAPDNDGYAHCIADGLLDDLAALSSVAGALTHDALIKHRKADFDTLLDNTINPHDVDLFLQLIRTGDGTNLEKSTAIVYAGHRARRVLMMPHDQWFDFVVATAHIPEGYGVFVPADLAKPGPLIRIDEWCADHNLPPPSMWLNRIEAA